MADDSEREWADRVYLLACKVDRMLHAKVQEARSTLERLGDAAERSSVLKSQALATVGLCLRKREAGEVLPVTAFEALGELEGELGQLESLVDPW